MVLTLYEALGSPPCRSVLMAAKKLGIQMKTKNIDMMKDEHNKPEFLKINPAHCVPVLDDNGFHLWESRAIMTYLANKYAPDSSLYPKDPQKRAVVDKMLYFDIGTLYVAEGNFLFPYVFEGQPRDAEKEAVFKQSVALFNELLSGTTYAAGNNLTLADISLLSSVTFIEGLIGYDFSEFDKVNAWMKKLKKELPDYKEIYEKPVTALKELFKV